MSILSVYGKTDEWVDMPSISTPRWKYKNIDYYEIKTQQQIKDEINSKKRPQPPLTIDLVDPLEHLSSTKSLVCENCYKLLDKVIIKCPICNILYCSHQCLKKDSMFHYSKHDIIDKSHKS